MDQKRKATPRSASTRALGANYFRLMSVFNSLCDTLRADQYAERLDKSLAFWTTAGDRRLPQAFLGHSLDAILSTPFEELCNTPGIGQKKIISLIKLLQRVAKEEPSDGVLATTNGEAPHAKGAASRNGELDWSTVSELQWDQWRCTVERRGLSQHSLGQLVASLQSLPKVMWNVVLATYLTLPLAEIRQLKTHGEKRVRVVLGVFYDLHQFFQALPAREHWAVQLLPARMAAADGWVECALANGKVPTLHDISARFAAPLLDQLLVDLGSAEHDLAEGRLGIKGSVQQVGQQAKRMGVTRARVYQLFEDCRKALAARWPQGCERVDMLVTRLEANGISGREQELLLAIRELFFTGLPESERAKAQAS